MKPKTMLAHLVRQNIAHQCNVHRCTAQRVNISPYCARHYAAVCRNGHPTAAPVPESLWRPYRPRVRALLDANPDHPMVTHVQAFLRQWLSQAAALDGRRGCAWAGEVARLGRHGVSPLDLMTELAAVHVALREHPEATQGALHRDFAASKAICQLAPRPRTVTLEARAKGTHGYAKKPLPSALRHIAPHLQQALAPLLALVVQALEQEQFRAKAEADRMWQPLAPSLAAVDQAVRAADPSPITTKESQE
jgi:hypothetical protein